MLELKQQSIDLQCDLADTFMAEFSGLFLTDKEKLELVSIIDTCLKEGEESGGIKLLQFILSSQDLQETFKNLILECEEYLSSEEEYD